MMDRNYNNSSEIRELKFNNAFQNYETSKEIESMKL